MKLQLSFFYQKKINVTSFCTFPRAVDTGGRRGHTPPLFCKVKKILIRTFSIFRIPLILKPSLLMPFRRPCPPKILQEISIRLSVLLVNLKYISFYIFLFSCSQWKLLNLIGAGLHSISSFKTYVFIIPTFHFINLKTLTLYVLLCRLHLDILIRAILIIKASCASLA